MSAKRSQSKWIGSLALMVMVAVWPAMGWASVGGDGAVSMMTGVGLLSVLAAAVLVRLGLWVGRKLRYVRAEQELQWSRQLRVVFGGLILVAALSPYVAVHYSTLALVGLVVAGVVVAVWGWGRGEMIDREVGRA